MALPCCTSADLSESSSLETVVKEGSSSDNVLTLGGFISHCWPLLFDIARKNNLPLANITIKNVKIAEA